MLSLATKYMQITRRIVLLITVLVMYHFTESKFTTKHIFCNPTMHQRITILEPTIPFIVNISFFVTYSRRIFLIFHNSLPEFIYTLSQ